MPQILQLFVVLIQRWKVTISVGLLVYIIVGLIYPSYHFKPPYKDLEIRDDERNFIRGNIPTSGSRNVIWDVYRLRCVDQDHYLIETSNGNIVFSKSEVEPLRNILTAYNQFEDDGREQGFGTLSCGEFRSTKAVFERMAGLLPSTKEDETPALQLSPSKTPKLNTTGDKLNFMLSGNSLRLLPKYRVPRLLRLLDRIPDLERTMQRRESSPLLESWREILSIGLDGVKV